MKKIAFALLAISTFTLAAYAVLDRDWFDGANHYCHYTDDRVIKVGGAENRPLSVD